MIRLLSEAFENFSDELFRRLAAAGFGDIRPGHGCVFGSIDPEGSRLTDLAERAHMTKQSVGEAATDLVRRGYVERLPDATDGRVKIIRLTDRGREAQRIGLELIDDIERDWAERYGEAEIAALRETLEAIAAAHLSPVPA
jgi:DNA-binding MarR family transcriptional regulator